MTTVIAENRNTLRPAMVVKCGFRETDDVPSSITPTGLLSVYEPFANVNTNYPTVELMDLSGDGFLNNGYTQPIIPETDTLYRYGFISEEASLTEGTFSTGFGVTITASEEWDYVTLELMDNEGNISTQSYQPTWSGGSCSVFAESWTPNARCHIIGVYLGKAWAWNVENLVNVSLELRGVNTEIGGEMEVSTIEIQAYEPTDYTDVIGRVPDGSPIWYTAGYDGDMSEMRYFYKTENVEWENNIIKVKGQDATGLMDNKTMYAKYVSSSYDQIQTEIVDRIDDALDGVTYTTEGTIPVGANTTSEILLFEESTPRESIASLTGLFRTTSRLRVTYVDAGIPTLHLGDTGFNTWTIYADEIGDLKYEIEPNINEVTATLYRAKTSTSDTMSMTVDGTAGDIQEVTFDKICVPANVSISPTPSSWTVLSPYGGLLVPANDETYTITCSRTIKTVIANGDSPYTYNNGSKGFTYAFTENMQRFTNEDGHLTKLALADLLNRSNLVYEFTYRGNPHIQPRDIINVQLAKWANIRTVVDGLYPDTDLYPDADLYPDVTYDYPRKLTTEWVTMTVDTVTLEHAEGGLTSTIRARKGAV